MAIATPIALFPKHDELYNIQLREYPELNAFLESDNDWHKQHWLWAKDYLLYIGRNKSEHTYTRFRNEVERFLLWAFLVKEKPIDEFRKGDILEYADFCWQPPVNWICLNISERFSLHQGEYNQNKQWAPFRLKLPKNETSITPDKKKYKPSQQTLTATFTALSAFYKYLMNEEICYGNPAQIAKKDCRYFVTDAQVKEIKRLTSAQWDTLLEMTLQLANNDPLYERSLFIMASLKTLFLRISELSERRDWSPIMSHFWEDQENNWWLKIYGKGRKIRDITVPQSFIPYLKRYRKYRGLPELPYQGDNSPIVEKIRGQGGMSARQLARIVQDIFDLAYEKIKSTQGEDKARKLKEASSHWLRHTGASMEVERGRALKDISEDLGHASMATTDTIYVQTENKKRAESGKKREV